MAKKQAFEFFFNQLVKGYRSIMGKDPEGLDLIKIKQEARQKLIDQDKVIEVQFGKPFSEEISIMDQINKSKNKIEGASNKIDEIMNEQADMYRPKTDAEIKAKFDKQNKESIERLKKKKEDDPGFYTGGMVDVEPNLSDIGHGSDALMARTRLVSPDGQATTSTGLNYLLAEDNDNIRVPFSDGKNFEMYLREREGIEKNQNMERLYREYLEDMRRKKVANQKQMVADGGRIGFAAGGGGRRAFLKLLATLGGGVAAAKSGILGLGKGGGKQITKEVAKEVATGSGTVPPYFLNLVKKIKNLGDETLASQDKAIAKKYKDYVMEEDFAGNITIMKKGDDVAGNKTEDVYMSLKVDEVPLKGKKGSTKVEEYEEFTARPDAEGKMKDIEPGVPDEVVQEGTMFEDNMTEFGKADGGRIGLFLGGGLTYGKSLLKNMLKFMSKDGSHKKSPAEILKMMNPKQYEKLLNNPKYQGQVSSEAPEGLDKIIQDMIGKTKTERSDMIDDIISASRNIKKVDDDILKYKLTIIEDMVSKGIDREIAVEAAENISKEVAKSAGKKSTPKITEQGLLELENLQKNLLTKDRKLQAQGGLTTMLGE